jgi:pseudo-rSAM protein
MESPFWFYLEPYVHLSCRGDDALFYNCLSGEHLIYWNNPDIAAVARRLLSLNNMRVIRLDASDINRPPLAGFIKKTRNAFMGDIIDTVHSQGKPVLMMHRPKIQKEVHRLKKEDGRSIGEGILEYLYEVSIHINGDCNEECPGCRDYDRQFLCCTRPKRNRGEIPLSTLSNFMDQIRGSGFSRLNLLGGNIFRYHERSGLKALLEKINVKTVFYHHYRHLSGYSNDMDILDFDAAEYRVIVTPPYQTKPFQVAYDKLGRQASRTKYLFVVPGEKELKAAKDMAAAFKIDAFGFKPYFTGNNDSFFHRNVFVHLKDIFLARPTQKDIFANMSLNRLFFGRLVIQSNGAVHAGRNAPALGVLGKDSIHRMLHKEMDRGKIWMRTRLSVKPCRNCILSALCPPMGTYETALKRNNLCTVWPKSGRP